MTDRLEEFIVGDRPKVSVKATAGSVQLNEGVDHEIRVEITGPSAAAFTVEQSADTITVMPPRDRFGRGMHTISLSVPHNIALTADVASADVLVDVPLEAAKVSSASGNISLSRVRIAELKTASGNLEVGSTERARLKTASGDVAVGVGSDINAVTASGDIRVGESTDTATLKTASGEIRVDVYDGPSLSVKSVSGDVHVGLRSGRSVKVDIQTLSGSMNLPSEPNDGSANEGQPLKLRAHSVSGDINLAITPQ